MNKTNLVFDFSNMAMRALFTCSYANAGAVTTFDTDEECGILIRKIAMDMAYVTRIFTPDRVIVACDARDPWRRSLYDDIEDAIKVRQQAEIKYFGEYRYKENPNPIQLDI